MPDELDNRHVNRRLLIGVVVVCAALAGMFTTGTRAMWVFDAIAVVGTMYVLGSSPKRRGRGE